MARLPEPTLNKITVLEPYEGVEEDRKKFLECLTRIVDGIITKDKEVS